MLYGFLLNCSNFKVNRIFFCWLVFCEFYYLSKGWNEWCSYYCSLINGSFISVVEEILWCLKIVYVIWSFFLVFIVCILIIVWFDCSVVCWRERILGGVSRKFDGLVLLFMCWREEKRCVCVNLMVIFWWINFVKCDLKMENLSWVEVCFGELRIFFFF